MLFNKKETTTANMMKAMATSSAVTRAMKAVVEHFKLDEKEALGVFAKEFEAGLKDFLELVKKS